MCVCALVCGVRKTGKRQQNYVENARQKNIASFTCIQFHTYYMCWRCAPFITVSCAIYSAIRGTGHGVYITFDFLSHTLELEEMERFIDLHRIWHNSTCTAIYRTTKINPVISNSVQYFYFLVIATQLRFAARIVLFCVSMFVRFNVWEIASSFIVILKQ